MLIQARFAHAVEKMRHRPLCVGHVPLDPCDGDVGLQGAQHRHGCAGILATTRLRKARTINAVRRRESGALADGSTAYPAIQNLLLAARAYGLGAVLTTQHFFMPGGFERIVNLPTSARLVGVVPLGYAMGKFGTVTRPEPRSVMSWDRYQVTG